MVQGHAAAFPGQSAEEVQNQAADGIELRGRQLQAQGPVEIRQGQGGLDPPDPRGDLYRGFSST